MEVPQVLATKQSFLIPVAANFQIAHVRLDTIQFQVMQLPPIRLQPVSQGLSNRVVRAARVG